MRTRVLTSFVQNLEPADRWALDRCDGARLSNLDDHALAMLPWFLHFELVATRLRDKELWTDLTSNGRCARALHLLASLRAPVWFEATKYPCRQRELLDGLVAQHLVSKHHSSIGEVVEKVHYMLTKLGREMLEVGMR